MLSFQFRGNTVTTAGPDEYGIEEATQGKVSDFSKYIAEPGQPAPIELPLARSRLHVQDHQATGPTPPRKPMAKAGWKPVARWPSKQEFFREQQNCESTKATQAAYRRTRSRSPPLPRRSRDIFDPAKEQHDGLVLGIACRAIATRMGKTPSCVLPGEDGTLTCPTAARLPKIVSGRLHDRRLL